MQKFFDSVPHDLIGKAVQARCGEPWLVLYVRRWLTAPLALPDGTLADRDRGTPQGFAMSPVLARLFIARHVRRVDDPDLAGHPVRALCRRRGRALRQPLSGGDGAGRDREQDGRGRLQLHPAKTRS